VFQFSARAIIFLCSEATERVSKTTQLPIRSVLGTLSSEVKRQQRENSNHFHLLPSSKKVWSSVPSMLAQTICFIFYLTMRRSTSARLDSSLLQWTVYTSYSF